MSGTSTLLRLGYALLADGAVNDLRQIPDNQEVFAHPSTDQSLIVEIMEFHNSENDEQAARTYFEDLAESNGSRVENESLQLSQCHTSQLSLDGCTSCQLISGQQSIAKFKDSAQNRVDVHMAVLRVPTHQTDLIITFNNTISISPESSSYGAQPLTSQSAWTVDDYMNAVKSLTLVDAGIFG